MLLLLIYINFHNTKHTTLYKRKHIHAHTNTLAEPTRNTVSWILVSTSNGNEPFWLQEQQQRRQQNKTGPFHIFIIIKYITMVEWNLFSGRCTLWPNCYYQCNDCKYISALLKSRMYNIYNIVWCIHTALETIGWPQLKKPI